MWQFRPNTTSTVVCLAGCALLVLIQRTIPEPVGGILTALMFLVMILVAGVISGWKSGVAATTLGIFAASVFFSPPYITRAASSSIELLRLVSYGFLGLILSAICGLLQHAWRRIEDRQHRLELEVKERQKAQLGEKARADELLTTLASIGDGVIRTDAEGRITFLNPVAERLIGWTTEEAAGRMLSEIFQVVNASTHERVENPAIQALQNGCIVGMTNDTILISRDGKERPIDDSAAPIRDAFGAVIGSVLVFRDISDRKAAEQALRESERRYRAVGEFIDYGVWVCDSAGRNTYTSEAFLRLVGLTQEEFSTSGWAAILHPDDAEATIDAWQECVRSGGRWDREHRIKGIDGHWHYVLARGIPTRNDLEEITSWVGINLDISRLKEVEAELRNADRRKDEFLATLAHELRNPLAPIANSLQILKMPGVSEEIVQQTREMMERQVLHLVRLVDDLLDVSRVMQGKIELRLETVDLASVVERAVETAQPHIEAQGHRLEISLPSAPLQMIVDPIRLAQVIGNLLTNSAKYTERNGHIRLEARQEIDQAVISVRDNGIGIAPEMLAQIFDLFVQADLSSTKSQGGLGIGLTLVRNLVEMHGGSVKAQSAGVGKGCEFLIHLPLVSDTYVVPTGREQVNAVDASSGSRLRLLVVDDNKDAASSIAMLLQLRGHEVRVVDSGLAALETIATYIPDLVLLDIGMPAMDGYEVSRRFRRTPGLEKTVLVALTGWSQPEDFRRTADAGFDHHLVKPVELPVLEKLLTDTYRSLSGT